MFWTDAREAAGSGMEDRYKSSQPQYFSIQWRADVENKVPFGNVFESPKEPGKENAAPAGSITGTTLLPHMAIVYANTREAGSLRIVAINGALTLAGRGSESLQVAWDAHAVPPIAADATFAGTLSAHAEIRLASGEALIVLAPHNLIAPRDLPRIALSTVSTPALDVLLAQAGCLVGRDLPEPVATLCETALAGLLAMAIEDGEREQVRPDSRDLLYREVLADIAANCRRHDYGVTQVAQRHKLNVRTLQKMFQQRGTTLKEHITASRLQIARAALLDPGNAGRKVSDIAFEAGFNDIATFNRLFRRRFSQPPSAFRARGSAQEGGADVPASPQLASLKTAIPETGAIETATTEME